MKIVNLILLAFPLFFASLLLVINPAHASQFKSTSAVQMIVVTSTQANLDIVTPQINNITHSVIEQAGCSCTNCVQANLQKLQGKLPMAGI
ncbi:hypothetical protein IQ226_19190 [Dolichospermum sp. LEGE 00240]|jgi:hypothetical protein|uniref:hypothetical protein n=1 Tax=Dolichospermum sp. LEGE 00240 TaxID=1828603 RepID=UPI00187DF4BA|nr:hypothetical protein [Dolichospermum sp. LEGE 00240]MBE9251217.1 hypothetical protein [Dolichospermum sp. LEGE 00240]MDM3845081.1 hypothetical protein [Aphanizomenon gracile PMC638.10]MDM3853959.1 hypothetical protein [Aphanizomenon gracile PMC649.10]MDM3858701.1 hypothetical protein [Aphanizomenon gracile PMC644.10]